MAIRWTQEVEGGPRRVNHAAVSVRNRFIFSFGGYCTGDEYNQIVNIDVHVFDTGEFVEGEAGLQKCPQSAQIVRAVGVLNVLVFEGGTNPCQKQVYRTGNASFSMRASYLTVKSIC